MVALTTTLRPAWARLARLVWLVLAASALLLFAIGAPRALRQPFPSCANPNPACSTYNFSQEDMRVAAGLGLPVPLLTLLVFAGNWLAKFGLVAVALTIFWRRRDDWVAYLLSLSLVLVVVEGGFPEMGPLQPLVDGLYAVSFLAYMPVPFLFPNGRFEPRWMGWVALPLTLLLLFGLPSLPTYVPAANALWLPWIGLAIYAVVYRFVRGATTLERQQLKWLGAALLLPFMTTVTIIPINLFFPPSQPSPERLLVMGLNELLYVGGYLAAAVCVAIAILRYRLWDIDVIIRRTLLYSLLTALLALVYAGSIVVLQTLFSVLTGAVRSELVTVLSTLAIAALFVPLRRRLQDFIDRRFYRHKVDAAEALAAFGQAARDEVDLARLNDQLLAVVDETMQPQMVDLWLRGPR